MVRISIVEDEKEARDMLVACLKRFASERNIIFGISPFSNPLNFSEDYDPKTDIVFMDILLPDLNGMETCKRLRKMDENVTIIFVTNLASYAIRGYEVEAMDFIVKPVSYDSFALKLERALGRVKANEDTSISFSTAEGNTIVSVADITYIEIRYHHILVHARDRIYETYGTLKNFEKQFNPEVFCRCNSCYLVNLNYVQSIDGFTAKVAGQKLQISHPRKKSFVSSLNKFLGRGLHV